MFWELWKCGNWGCENKRRVSTRTRAISVVCPPRITCVSDHFARVVGPKARQRAVYTRAEKYLTRGAVCGGSERSGARDRSASRASSPVIRDNFQLAAGYHRTRWTANAYDASPTHPRTHACRNGPRIPERNSRKERWYPRLWHAIVAERTLEYSATRLLWIMRLSLFPSFDIWHIWRDLIPCRIEFLFFWIIIINFVYYKYFTIFIRL